MRDQLPNGLLVVGVVLAIACSSVRPSVSPSESAIAESKSTTAPTSWVASGLPVHTRLSATKDSIVYGGVEGTRLYVVALDPATGQERWRRRSNFSARVPGVEQSILTDEERAYFLADLGRDAVGVLRTRLVAVTTATGEELWYRDLEPETSVDPNAHWCREAICLIAHRSGMEIWRLSKTDGSDVARIPLDSVTGGSSIIFDIEETDGADPVVLMASTDPWNDLVFIAQYRDLGKKRVWFRSTVDLFGSTPVRPDRGWSVQRVAGGGWFVWLGPKSKGPLKAGDTTPPGTVAGFDDRGNSRWIAVGRRTCGMFRASTAVLCDGEMRMIDSDHTEVRPEVAEGRDATTGTVTWKLDLHREVDEFDTSDKVLRIDGSRYLIALSSGPIEIDVHQGPKPAPVGPATGWCTPKVKSEGVRLFPLASYVRARNPFPCRLGGEHAEPSLPIPEFAGVNVAGWSAWVQDGQVHAKRQSD